MFRLRRLGFAVGLVGMVAGILAPAASASPANPTTVTVGAVQGLLPAVDQLHDVACPTASLCYGVGYNGLGSGSARLVPIVNGVAGAAVTVPGAVTLDAIACASATTCYTAGRASFAGFASVVVPIVNGVPGAVQAVTGQTILTGVACTTATTCIVVGEVATSIPSLPAGAIIPIVNGLVTAPVPDPAVTRINRVACPTAATCYATAVTGAPVTQTWIVTIAGGVAGVPVPVTGLFDLLGIACTSATACQAVGRQFVPSLPASYGALVAVNAGVPSAPQIRTNIDGLNAIDCPPANACVAAGSISTSGGWLVPISNGGPDALVPVGDVYGTPTAIACPTATTCIGVGEGSSGGVVVPMTVVSPVAVATTSLPAGQVGVAYTSTLTASGGTSPYAWSVVGGALPPGLTLSPAGTISGSPTTAGTFNFTVQVVDAGAVHTATAAESILVLPATPVPAPNPLLALIGALLALIARILSFHF